MAILMWTLLDMWILTGPTRTKNNHDFKWRPRAARTDYSKFSCFNRFANYWNSLLNFVMSASSLDSFRTRLLNYLCTWFYFVISKWDYSDFTFCLLFSCFSSFLFLIQRIVIYISLGEQFLYGNSVSPYCFPLPTVLLYGYY